MPDNNCHSCSGDKKWPNQDSLCNFFLWAVPGLFYCPCPVLLPLPCFTAPALFYGPWPLYSSWPSCLPEIIIDGHWTCCVSHQHMTSGSIQTNLENVRSGSNNQVTFICYIVLICCDVQIRGVDKILRLYDYLCRKLIISKHQLQMKSWKAIATLANECKQYNL